MKPALVVPAATQGEHSAGCTVLVLAIKTKFPLQSPDDHFLKGSNLSWHGKVDLNFYTLDCVLN